MRNLAETPIITSSPSSPLQSSPIYISSSIDEEDDEENELMTIVISINETDNSVVIIIQPRKVFCIHCIHCVCDDMTYCPY